MVNEKGVTTSVNKDDFIDEYDEEIQENQFLTFGLASETYGINILCVREIIRMVNIISIPETYEFIKGIINLRGNIIPVMDMRLKFHLNEKEYDDRTCIIVVNMKGLEMGLIVDTVAEVTEIPEGQIEFVPKMNNSIHKKYISGIGKVGNEVKILLDLDSLLFDEEIQKIKDQGSNAKE